MAARQIKGVEKCFGTTHIIRGVNIDIRDGQFTILVGPSSCGKSTLLRMIAGLEEITSGEVLIGGRDVNNMMPNERDIAMVFHNYALYPYMTERDNMALSLVPARQPKALADERVHKGRRHPGPESSAGPLSAPASQGNVSALPWEAASWAILRCSCPTNRCPISMPC